MNILKGIVTELRERRLWPVAVALLIGLVAVPVLLTSSPSTASVSPSQGAGVTGSTGKNVAIKLADGTGQGNLNGRPRDPFSQQGGSSAALALASGGATATLSTAGSLHAASAAASVGAGSPSASSSSGSASSSSGSAASAGSSATSGGSSASSGSSAPVVTPARVVSHKPAPAGLSATQSYAVAVQISNASGGLDLIDPLERLSPLPSASQPLLVELGVEQGAHDVLFAVQPGTVVSGAGSCTPGPIDCEILSLSPNQPENVSTQSAGGAPIAQFAVTGIYAQDHGSAGAANKARRTANAEGASLLTNSPLSALTLFQYQPSVGAVVDMRNLTVGGN